MSKQISEVLKEGISILDEHNKKESRLDARLLLEYTLNCDRVYLLINNNKEISEELYSNYIEYINYRASGKPLQHIMGKQQFMGLDFIVNKDVLIPRRETEELVELVINIIDNNNIKIVMDVGTGSGCIPISLRHKYNNIRFIGIDYSKKALEIASQNAVLNNIDDIRWIESNIFNNVDNKYVNNIDLITSNPPYIPTKEIDTLMSEVKNHEPKMALDGGEDGLYFYKEISKQGYRYLKDGGYIVYEVGHNQCSEIVGILREYKYKDISYKKDLSGINRIVFARK